jgi:PTS system mannose-specific IIA component
MISGLVITHGGLGEELVKVVTMILGPVEGLAAQSNRGIGVKELTAAVSGWAARQAEAGAQGVLLFIDDFGGSCANAAQIAAADGPPAACLTGINLAMLLDFVTWRDSLDLPQLARRLVDKGRHAIAIVGPGGGS